MTISEKLTTAAENVQRVYDAGYEKAKAEYIYYYDVFWDDFQENGNRTNYSEAFAAGSGFTDANYNPKYPIVCGDEGGSAYAMFRNNPNITDTKVLIDISQCLTSDYMFAYDVTDITEESHIETIRELRVSESTGFTRSFIMCVALKNITISGSIGKNISFEDSLLLTKASILSVVGALSDTATNKKASFHKYAIDAAFTEEEWAALQATKPNWQFIVYDPDEEE